MFLTKKKKKEEICFKFKKERDFAFEEAVKSKAMKPRTPTLTHKKIKNKKIRFTIYDLTQQKKNRGNPNQKDAAM